MTLKLPDSVEEIGNRAFNGCSALETITVGASVKKLGSYAFSACSSLKTVIFLGTADEWKALVPNETRVGLAGVTVVTSDTAQ